MMGGSGINWTICKSFAPHSRQRTTPVPHHSIFTGRMLFLMPNQQCQSTEGITAKKHSTIKLVFITNYDTVISSPFWHSTYIPVIVMA